MSQYPCPECGHEHSYYGCQRKECECENTVLAILGHHADRLTAELAAMTEERDGLECEVFSCHQVIESSGKQMGELRMFLANTHQELAASQARVKELEGVVKEMAERMAKGVR